MRRTVQLARHAELLACIRSLHAQGLRPPAIARALQAEGWRSAHGKGFTEGSVRALLTRMGVVSTSPKRPSPSWCGARASSRRPRSPHA